MKRFAKLSDLRPCDQCDGPIARGFWVLHMSQGMLRATEANAVLGLNQMFGGALGLAEVFAPGNPVLVFGDEDPVLYTTVIVCADCWLGGSLDLAVLFERIHSREAEAPEP